MRRHENDQGGRSPGLWRLVARGAVNAAVLLVAMLLALAVAEGVVRLVRPEYAYAADAEFASDGKVIWKPKPSTRRTGLHPDTQQLHTIIHNRLGARQHREFRSRDLEDRINLAFFGDSFTENLRVPAQYMFTEVLDFALNHDAPRVNVLNFGVDGYGTDQSYLHYLDTKEDVRLDIVVYVLCANDLRDIRKNGLFHMDGRGQLTHKQVEPPSPVVTALSRLYLTYLWIDVEQRLRARESHTADTAPTSFSGGLAVETRPRDSAPTGATARERARTGPLFLNLVDAWRRQVTSDGGRFYVVLLPRPEEAVLAELLPDDLAVLDLAASFERAVPGYRYADWRFESDGHWSEAGNMLAARQLYRFFESLTGSDPITDRQLQRRLQTYYAAYPEGWRYPGWTETAVLDDTRLAEIRQHYLALENRSTR